MSRVVVVGSGASGVHFALSALRLGHEVVMLDVGGERPRPVLPESDFHEMKDRLDDPVGYFLGDALDGVVFPGSRSTYYGFPPSKAYVFQRPERFRSRSSEMQPYFTFARGGFAETWTAGVYPFNDAELEEYPFGYRELAPAYAEVARRIGIGARRDDLERFLPFDADYLDPLPADPHSERLLDVYAARRAGLNRSGWYMGRSRVATLSRDYAGRKGCDGLGRCLWGCPTASIYTPAATLRECLGYDSFQYLAGLYVTHFEAGGDGQVRSIHAQPLAGGDPVAVRGDLFALGAGALMSSKIVLDSVYRATGELVELAGLMDNRQVHVPFLTPAMIGRPIETAAYQYHHLAFGLVGDSERDYVHGQITTLKAASLHPIVQSLPLDLQSGLEVFRAIRAGLGIANVNLHDTRRPESRVRVEPIHGGPETTLVIDYRDSPDEAERMRVAVKRVKRSLRRLGAYVPPGLTRVLPKGNSVHYAGTLPMSRERAAWHVDADCLSYDFPNLCLVDGATFPFLPAKNHTYTLMANAVRVAERVLA